MIINHVDVVWGKEREKRDIKAKINLCKKKGENAEPWQEKEVVLSHRSKERRSFKAAGPTIAIVNCRQAYRFTQCVQPAEYIYIYLNKLV